MNLHDDIDTSLQKSFTSGVSVTTLRVTFELMLVVIVIFMITGCMQATPPATAIPSSIPTNPAPTVKPISSTTAQPSHHWIRIDPIGDKQEGEIFTINATTNLSAGEEVLVQTYTSHFQPGGGRHPYREFSGGVKTVKVIQGTNGGNTISVTINSSEFHLFPDEYIVTEESIIDDTLGVAFYNITQGKTL